jgi:phosphate transport system permease protein
MVYAKVATYVIQKETEIIRFHRNRNSSRWVRVSDRIAKQIITVGGIGTIFVVMLVVFVLIGNVLPMFQANKMEPLASFTVSDGSEILGAGVDEYGDTCWTIHRDSTLRMYSVRTGKLLSEHNPPSISSAAEKPLSGKAIEVTCVAIADDDSSLLLGYDDGSVRPVLLKRDVTFFKATDLPEIEFIDGVAIQDNSILRQLPTGLIRKQSLESVTYHPSISLFESPILAVDWKTPQAVSNFDESMTWVFSATDGKSVALSRIQNKASLSGQFNQITELWKGTLHENEVQSPFQSLMIDSRGEHISTLNAAGQMRYWAMRGDRELEARQTHLSLAGSESKSTCVTPLLGRTTLIIGSESGHLEAVSMSAVGDNQELMSIHRFPGAGGKVLSIASSSEARVVAANFESGVRALYYVPTNQELIRWDAERNEPPKRDIFFSSNAKVVGLFGQNTVNLWTVDVPFPEASWSAFFGRIWYEGYSSPQHVWQSSTGSIEGEYKFGFMPLIFGTLKATFYSMLIGAPIALMAAIFGSEFMSSRWRMRIKPAIELMASVPSVVLGFIGALVLAPLLRDNLMAALISVPMVLFFFLLGAHFWLMVPTTIAIQNRHRRLPILILLIPVGLVTAFFVAGPIEQMLFGGSLTQWLSGQNGSGWSGWFCLGLLPMSMLVAWLAAGPVSPWLQHKASRMTSARFSVFNLGYFLVATLMVFVLSAIVAFALSSIGWDPRGSLVGPYQERNAILVGCILGFAIIPIIYTISEDALQSVPQHLRSASLGCGATTWQTTIRVVVPTAMSGLFSAIMIGFGRAVGETMVVLMAAGNTPLMDINPMNGYRTMSATLATELPEAARGSTHYHGLFLAALLLFCFTLVANTLAELVRMRFRKRAFQL